MWGAQLLEDVLRSTQIHGVFLSGIQIQQRHGQWAANAHGHPWARYRQVTSDMAATGIALKVTHCPVDVLQQPVFNIPIVL
jgi:hypothetical protein